MAPATERARRLESRQWVYRMSKPQFEKRNNDSDDDSDSDQDKGKGKGNKNKSKDRSSNRRDGGGGGGDGGNDDDDNNGGKNGGGKNGNGNGNRSKSNNNDDPDDDTDYDDNNNKNRDKNKNNNNTPPFTQPPPEATQVIQPPPDTTTQVIQGPPVVVTATADPKTVTVDPTTITMDPTTVILVSTMTPEPPSTSLSSFIPLQSLSSQPPRKGVDEPDSYPPDFYLPPTTTATATTSGTALANASPTDADYDMDNESNDSKHKHKDKSDSRDQTAEHILIGAGSIGIFITICLICFLGWRFMKKRKNPQRRVGGKFTEKMYAKMPWLQRSNDGGWQSLEDDNARGMATLARSNTNLSAATTIQESVIGYYGPNKQIVVMGKQALDAASTLGSTLPTMAPTTIAVVPAGAGLYQQTGTMSSTGYAYTSTDPTLTMRSRMPDPFFNQSELARQPSDAYDPIRRQVNRASELSSLSSGFGDGDMIVSQPFVQPPPPSAPSLRQSNNLVGRFSWQSRGASSNRETVYTESSEDSPARFRTVNSWVNQQTGRVKRAQQRAENGEEVPPVPDLPGVQPGVPGVPLATGMPIEHQYTMMLDFEEPKRPEKQD